jgi:hypothetical protein
VEQINKTNVAKIVVINRLRVMFNLSKCLSSPALVHGSSHEHCQVDHSSKMEQLIPNLGHISSCSYLSLLGSAAPATAGSDCVPRSARESCFEVRVDYGKRWNCLSDVLTVEQ